MESTIKISKKELAQLQILATQVLDITSRLKKELSPFKGEVPRKGKKMTRTQMAIARKNARIYKS